jgi:hypothetical protein
MTYDLSKGDWKFAAGAEAAELAAHALRSLGEAMRNATGSFAEYASCAKHAEAGIARWSILRRQAKMKGRPGWKALRPRGN